MVIRGCLSRSETLLRLIRINPYGQDHPFFFFHLKEKHHLPTILFTWARSSTVERLPCKEEASGSKKLEDPKWFIGSESPDESILFHWNHHHIT